MTKEEQFVNELIGYIFAYPDDDYMTMECLCRKLVKHGLLDKADGYYQTHDIRTNTHECVKDTHDKTEPRKEQNFCGKCRYLYRDFKYGLSCYRLMDNEPCKYEERKDEPKTQMKTQNSNLTFEKDECAKEYEELGLKELKELIEADRKTEPTSSKMEQVDDDAYFLELMGAVERGEISDAGANQAWYEYINHKDEP